MAPLGRTLAATALLAAAAVGARPAERGLARLAVVDRAAEIRRGDTRWTAAEEGAALSVGDGVRVEGDALARLELPWMAVTVSAGATFGFPDQPLLAAFLERGRALVEAEQQPMLKLLTPAAELRGQGRAVLHAGPRATTVTCLSGRFDVVSARGTVALTAGRGCVVLAGRRPSAPVPLPAPPARLSPGADPLYAAKGEPVELRWEGRAAGYQVELLPVGREIVLAGREVSGPALRLAIPWPGAFRWRVSARDARGIEGRPSEEGLLAVE